MRNKNNNYLSKRVIPSISIDQMFQKIVPACLILTITILYILFLYRNGSTIWTEHNSFHVQDTISTNIHKDAGQSTVAERELRIQQGIAQEILRFHVIANSDSNEDQALKLKVKDAVTQALKPKLEDANDIADARNMVAEELGNLEELSNNIIKENGFTYDDLEGWGGDVQFTSPTDGANAFRDGQVNAITASSVPKNPYLMDVSTTRDIVLLPVEESAAKNLEKFGYVPGVIPANSYRGQEEDVPSIYDSVLLIVNKNVDEEIVYQITKILCENKEKWVTVHSMWNEFEPSASANVDIPIHPGAQRYYDEMGY